jgi:pre-mRNA-splicing factor CDC5/CEF1
MKYHAKGGTWKNAEDEILKAAVMKYGLNQWPRISSLLVRKSSKQCKERWYNWLDPKLKKTEWTKEEEEQLITLVKMFPCQWKTIAPFLGRSAHMCIEHFQELLDKAENRQVDPNNDPRKLRPGEIDPNPESKPARPDPIDLDEDMKETLNEARARVANTRGKKAKRKIREKQLEEARKLATLQKKRELRAAGIEFHVRIAKRLLKETNYNRDVPFMREVPKGTWTDENDNETPPPDKFKADINLQYLEGRSRDIQEEKQRKKDEAKMKSLKLKNLPMAFELINKKYNFDDDRKEKIDLPKPEKNNEIINDDVEMKKEDEDNNDKEFENEEESEEDIDEEELNGGKASFDFLKMDLFKTDVNKKDKIDKIKAKDREKCEKIIIKKAKRKKIKLKKIKKF